MDILGRDGFAKDPSGNLGRRLQDGALHPGADKPLLAGGQTSFPIGAENNGFFIHS